MSLIIRAGEVRDARAIYQIMQQEQVMPYVMSLPSSRVEAFEEKYRNMDANTHDLVAERNGVIVGNAGLRQMPGRKSHNGVFYICVDAAHHGQGIGTALIEKVLDLADNWLMLERVELVVLASNPRAKALYERHGFVVEGIKKGACKSAGHYVDEISMGRLNPNGLLSQSQFQSQS